jgi:hypothetical protein
MHDISWIHLTILVLASFRLTHLIVFDEITSFIRDPFLSVTYEPDASGQLVRHIEIKGSGLRHWIGLLLSCHWCVGIWSSLAVLLIDLYLPSAFPLLVILAVAGAAAIIESKLYFG